MVGLNQKFTNIIEVFNVGRNVKAHCGGLITNVIISCTQRCLWENESRGCDSLRNMFFLIAKVTPRPQLLYVLVYWLTYHVMYQ